MLRDASTADRVVIGGDRSELALGFCRQRGLDHLVRLDALRLPIETDSLDLVMALDVVEHVADDAGCLAEAARVCRPGGRVIVHVPAFQALWTKKDELNHHYRRYRKEELRRLVESSALEIERIGYFNVALFPVAWLLARFSRVRRGEPTGKSAARTRREALGVYRIPEFVNRLLIGLLWVERTLLWRLPWPVGMSIVCVARKPTRLAPESDG